MNHVETYGQGPEATVRGQAEGWTIIEYVPEMYKCNDDD